MLFGKLQQGVLENQQLLQVAKLRADAEDLYGSKLNAIPAATNKNGGFNKDDGASVRKVCGSHCEVRGWGGADEDRRLMA